ncbi:WYL domain-containing protein [Faecalicatena contorta]|uniref:WYL domain-containing protein n=1 Tax=Faecalicatena contorta TaxID=39482 RepID=A0A316A1U9_9FIRM|nr:WYL domain-containing protein [Faecalicatena contorta]PWJ51563.1 WYL domain-containing protein [Faecalicatena contorta]SUQ13119.1 WYL domain-containing protein [Faecalicatena contorta]
MFLQDNYYLLCFSEKHQATCTYRIDRMDQVATEDTTVCPKAIVDHEDITSYTEQVFKMYGGKTEDVVLQFDDSLIGVVHDKFGEDTPMIRMNENTCIATVKVQVSPTFWGWLFQFSDKMKLLTPQLLKKIYINMSNFIS